MATPFVFGKLAGFAEFTNRSIETQRLLRNFESGINTILISPRRWGKSSLVQHAIAGIKGKKTKTCTLDLFSVRSEKEFYEQLSRSVLSATSNKFEEIAANTKEFLGKFFPTLSISPDANSEISIGLNWNELQKNPSDILQLAEKIAMKKKIKLVVCIDEFQNIAAFENPLAFQKALRAEWQKQRHVSYCLYGSKRHMMMDVFTKPSMPFYKFGDLLFLEKISEKDWQKFIVKRFSETGKKIDSKLALQICQLTQKHSYYTQQLAQQVWLRSTQTCKPDIIMAAHESLCSQLGLLFQMMTDALPTTQLNFLRALCDGETKLSAKSSIEKYNLGTSANVVRIKKALLEKEILDDAGNGLEFLDPYYQYWLKTRFFK